MHEALVTEALRHAIVDYSLLVERSYARASALKLVGDRYQLTSVQRTILYRGVCSAAEDAERATKRTESVRGLPLHVDALNVIYTIANYLYGRVLFISTDGCLRDAGEVHGSLEGAASTAGPDPVVTAVSLLLGWLASAEPASVRFYVDRPVSMSGRLAARLREGLAGLRLAGDATTVQSADYVLKRISDGVIATSDSTIIDAARCKVLDLAHHILDERYAPCLIDLRPLVEAIRVTALRIPPQ